MIRTKDLTEFIQQLPFQQDLPFAVEYRAEIVARLRAYDKLKESIEKLCHDLSTGIDKGE